MPPEGLTTAERACAFLSQLDLSAVYGSHTTDYEEDMPDLSWWLPHAFERDLIIALAHALAEDKERPRVLDVGCGSGLLVGMLATIGEIDAFGFDIDPRQLGRTPVIPPNTNLFILDAWSAPHILGPRYPLDIAQRRRELFTHIHKSTQEEPAWFTYGPPSVNVGERGTLINKVSELQQLAPRQITESPVHIALCSFMAEQKELTLPIRDGIFPRCIIYVREADGNSGAGDYYLQIDTNWREEYRDEMTEGFEQELISYSPGINYKTVARWPTFSKNAWSSYERYGKFFGFEAEVVVQIRNDVSPQHLLLRHDNRFSWDDEIERALVKQGLAESFYTALNQAQVSITGQ